MPDPLRHIDEMVEVLHRFKDLLSADAAAWENPQLADEIRRGIEAARSTIRSAREVEGSLDKEVERYQKRLGDLVRKRSTLFDARSRLEKSLESLSERLKQPQPAKSPPAPLSERPANSSDLSERRPPSKRKRDSDEKLVKLEKMFSPTGNSLTGKPNPADAAKGTDAQSRPDNTRVSDSELAARARGWQEKPSQPVPANFEDWVNSSHRSGVPIVPTDPGDSVRGFNPYDSTITNRDQAATSEFEDWVNSSMKGPANHNPSRPTPRPSAGGPNSQSPRHPSLESWLELSSGGPSRDQAMAEPDVNPRLPGQHSEAEDQSDGWQRWIDSINDP